jgi:PIN domain nuclease of toxin-antitoxin system
MFLAVSDTHPLLDYSTGKQNRLGTKALRLFENADKKDGSALIYIPSIVLVECFLIIQGGRVTLRTNYDSWVSDLKKHGFFVIYPLDVEEVVQASKLVGLQDPYDRMIAAVALQLDMPLLTKDQKITESGLVDVIWDD